MKTVKYAKENGYTVVEKMDCNISEVLKVSKGDKAFVLKKSFDDYDGEKWWLQNYPSTPKLKSFNDKEKILIMKYINSKDWKNKPKFKSLNKELAWAIKVQAHMPPLSAVSVSNYIQVLHDMVPYLYPRTRLEVLKWKVKESTHVEAVDLLPKNVLGNRIVIDPMLNLAPQNFTVHSWFTGILMQNPKMFKPIQKMCKENLLDPKLMSLRLLRQLCLIEVENLEKTPERLIRYDYYKTFMKMSKT